MGCLSGHPVPAARRRRLPAIGLAALVLLSLLGRPAVADSVQQQLERVWSRSRQVEREARRREGRLQEIQAGVRSAAAAHARAQAELERARAELARAEQDLQDAEAQVARTAAELAAVTERLEQKQQQLGQRVRALYLEGRVEYLEVLLGATSFGDFISRFHLLQSVVRQDSRLVREVRLARAEVAYRLEQDRQAQDRAVALRAGARQRRDQVADRAAEVAGRRQELNRQEQQERQALDQLEREAQQLERDIRKLEQESPREVGQLALSDPVRPVRITRGFGRLLHPILREYRPHAGVDLAADTGDSVYAAADGTVILAQWQSGYGYVVAISHGRVQGKPVSTLYAHNSKVKVRPGQAVRRGEVIALAGSTGLSTGPHLHFEVHVDGKAVDPLPWLGR